MKMNKGLILVPIAFITIALAIGILSTIGGFSLANPNAGTGESPDQLIGIMVTDGPWSQSESATGSEYYPDNGTLVATTDLTTQPGAVSDERIYATIRHVPDSNGDETQPYEPGNVTFEGMNGVVFFLQREEEYLFAYSDNNLFDVGTWINCSDQNESITIAGSIAVLPVEISDANYFFHPIFQSNDGRIYVTPGRLGIQAPMADGESNQALSVKNTESDSDKEKSSEFSVKVNLVGKYSPISITIIQVDEKNEAISRLSFEPGQLPETFVTENGTEYIIVEETIADVDGVQSINRSIVNRGEEFLLTYFYPTENSLGTQQTTSLEWQK